MHDRKWKQSILETTAKMMVLDRKRVLSSAKKETVVVVVIVVLDTFLFVCFVFLLELDDDRVKNLFFLWFNFCGRTCRQQILLLVKKKTEESEDENHPSKL